MAKKTAAPKPEDGKQDIEVLTQRYQDLNERKIEAQTNLKTAEGTLKKLRGKAKEEYGTDDLEELRKKLQEMKDENERKRAEYQQALDKIETDLENVEKAHEEAAAGVAATAEDGEGQ